ncbi:biosynthetic arginine decarboxylase [Paralimibaculum aggregatum]|uniref:Arginine decarboxylase n=1 Tax=Paralimibaculum aggregatum TaxID=3036245 RepID=A0ABQ6LG23_9RHOB|nr:biosynthetic arginine decarboxylase [Limibaculum sp. NKW23]GMG81942.1 biosynthetic arginine decarboxylase [Limibaculum sp. NKW23]
MDASAVKPADIYGIERWGQGLLKVLESGEVGLVNPLNEEAAPVPLLTVMHELETRGIRAPVLVRVNAFLEHQLRRLNESFAEAIRAADYGGSYRGVFPIKVNQQAEVVDRIVTHGAPYGFGLEAGSKPELLIALSRRLAPDALVICNGIKDAEFVRLAILAQKLGITCVIVLESPRELDTVLAEARALGLEPTLGVRVKLTRQISGKWAESSGDRSAFGMTMNQVVEVLDKLAAEGLSHCLTLQHSHLGSQIPNVNEARMAADEAARVFVELTREGAPLTHLDLGGGLGIDYTGEHRAAPNSVNYSLGEYCANLVETVKFVFDAAEVKHPTLVTESGRATVATSSMLIFNVLEATYYDRATPETAQEGDNHLLQSLAEIPSYVSVARLQECISDATWYREELRALFRRGQIGLREMARAERVYLYAVERIKRVAAELEEVPEEIAEALEGYADIYHGNFSLFQSLPDIWAIDQVHPVMPLQRLGEAPTRRAVLSDITCDSDGKIDRFVLADGVHHALPVHDLREDEPYYLGVFFVGAYQETLGDLHNLFGDTNVVTIDLRADGGYDLLHEVEGDSIAEVLSYVEYDPRDALDAFKARVEAHVSSGGITTAERRELIALFKDSLAGYTYYEH